MKTSLSVLLGFFGGALVGFVWAQQTKASLADNIETDFSGGVLTVSVDAQKAAVTGLANIFN